MLGHAEADALLAGTLRCVDVAHFVAAVVVAAANLTGDGAFRPADTGTTVDQWHACRIYVVFCVLAALALLALAGHGLHDVGRRGGAYFALAEEIEGGVVGGVGANLRCVLGVLALGVLLALGARLVGVVVAVHDAVGRASRVLIVLALSALLELGAGIAVTASGGSGSGSDRGGRGNGRSAGGGLGHSIVNPDAVVLVVHDLGLEDGLDLLQTEDLVGVLDLDSPQGVVRVVVELAALDLGDGEGESLLGEVVAAEVGHLELGGDALVANAVADELGHALAAAVDGHVGLGHLLVLGGELALLLLLLAAEVAVLLVPGLVEGLLGDVLDAKLVGSGPVGVAVHGHNGAVGIDDGNGAGVLVEAEAPNAEDALVVTADALAAGEAHHLAAGDRLDHGLGLSGALEGWVLGLGGWIPHGGGGFGLVGRGRGDGGGGHDGGREGGAGDGAEGGLHLGGDVGGGVDCTVWES